MENADDNLEEVFEDRLRSINRMVAMLDTWKNPLYVKRIWTIYEQYSAAKLKIPMVMIMPPKEKESFHAELKKGEEGMNTVKQYIGEIDVEHAKVTRT